jgi:hypothetical protein
MPKLIPVDIFLAKIVSVVSLNIERNKIIQRTLNVGDAEGQQDGRIDER